MKNQITELHRELLKSLELKWNCEISADPILQIIADAFPEPMTEAKARTVLSDKIEDDGWLFGKGLCWDPNAPSNIDITGRYTAEQLEAIAFWMKFKGDK